MASYRAGLLVVVSTVASCNEDRLPAAPTACQEPLVLVTPWWNEQGGEPRPSECQDPGYLLDRLAAEDGTAYYATDVSLCAADAAGMRTLSSSASDAADGPAASFIADVWVEGDRLLFTDGQKLYSVPRAGGDRAPVLAVPEVCAGPYAYDGAYLYCASGIGETNIYRIAITGGEPQLVLAGGGGYGVSSMRVAGDRLDFVPFATPTGGSGALIRTQLATGSVTSIALSSRGQLLASVGDFSYVAYATRPVSEGLSDDTAMALGAVGGDGRIGAAWTGDVPHFVPMAATAYADTLYSGGRLYYRGEALFLGLVALPVGSDRGSVLGCSPTTGAAGTESARVSAIAADAGFVYAIVSRTSAGKPTEKAIARFSRP